MINWNSVWTWVLAVIGGYVIGGIIFISLASLLVYMVTSNGVVVAIGLLLAVVVIVSRFYKWFWSHKLVLIFLTVLIVWGVSRLILGPEYLSSLWGLKDAATRDGAIGNNQTEQGLETKMLMTGTALYAENGEKVLYKGKLPLDLVVRVVPGVVEVEAVKYRKVKFPVLENGIYLEGIFDSRSVSYLVLPDALRVVKSGSGDNQLILTHKYPTQAVYTASIYEQGTSGPNTWTLKYQLPEGLNDGDRFVICPFGVEFTQQKKSPEATVFVAGENITTVRGTSPSFPKMPLVFTNKMREYPFVEVVASGWPLILRGELKIVKVN